MTMCKSSILKMVLRETFKVYIVVPEIIFIKSSIAMLIFDGLQIPFHITILLNFFALNNYPSSLLIQPARHHVVRAISCSVFWISGYLACLHSSSESQILSYCFPSFTAKQSVAL